MSTEQGDGFGQAAYRNGGSASRAFAGPSQAEFDALTDLFLGGRRGDLGGDAREGNRSPASERRKVGIEALIVGHLPVLAGAWIGQYLRHVASGAAERVGLVRCTRDHVFVDVAGEGPSRQADAPGGLAQALRSAGARRWILVAPPAEEMELAAIATEGGLDSVTVLTGADEAAVVACYSTIKTLSERAGSGRSAMDIGVALVGASAERAAEIGERMERATGQFLGRPARITARIDRVSGGGTARIYGGSEGASARELLELVRAAMQEPARASNPVGPSARIRQPISAASASQPAHLPVTATAASESPATAETLTSHVSGLGPLGLVCPYAPDVEFATSKDGAVHVLARDDNGRGFAGLAVASAWVRAHVELIASAHGGVRPDTCIQHLFAVDAGAVRSLMMTDIRVHLLKTVCVGGTVVAVCVDLN